MPWIILLIAGLFEIGWAIGLKYTEGFTRLWPSVGTVTAMAISGTASDPNPAPKPLLLTPSSSTAGTATA